MTEPPLLALSNVSVGFGGLAALKGVNLSLSRGEVVSVIGPNGAGKTTLFRMITGAEKPDAGTLRLGDTVELAYVDQSRDTLDAKKTVWEEISGGADKLMVGKREVASRAYVASFNFRGSDQQKFVGDLSGGERNRVHLAKLLKRGGNLLLNVGPRGEDALIPGPQLQRLKWIGDWMIVNGVNVVSPHAVRRSVAAKQTHCPRNFLRPPTSFRTVNTSASSDPMGPGNPPSMGVFAPSSARPPDLDGRESGRLDERSGPGESARSEF